MFYSQILAQGKRKHIGLLSVYPTVPLETIPHGRLGLNHNLSFPVHSAQLHQYLTCPAPPGCWCLQEPFVADKGGQLPGKAGFVAKVPPTSTESSPRASKSWRRMKNPWDGNVTSNWWPENISISFFLRPASFPHIHPVPISPAFLPWVLLWAGPGKRTHSTQQAREHREFVTRFHPVRNLNHPDINKKSQESPNGTTMHSPNTPNTWCHTIIWGLQTLQTSCPSNWVLAGCGGTCL